MAELQELKRKALFWLSKRDYSEYQLRQKLSQSGSSDEQAEQIVAWCKAQNYLNQQRYLEKLIRYRSQQGYGLYYLLQECQQQQISKDEIELCLSELQPDWYQLARQTYVKKFGDTPISETKEQIKRMAYLRRRGFSQPQIQYAMTKTDQDNSAGTGHDNDIR